jgi:dimethylamine monooxygenase subunit B
LIPMMEELDRRGVPFELHYSIRTLSRGAYVEQLTQAYGGRVKIYETGNAQRPSMDRVLAQQPLGTHLYVCGPERMMESVLSSARGAGWPSEYLHTERFLGASGGRPFTVELAKSNRRVQVREHESLLEAVEAAGVEAPYLCRGGSCGQCETRILACDGTILHKDHYLSAEERNSGSKLMICVSRLERGTVVLDL